MNATTTPQPEHTASGHTGEPAGRGAPGDPDELAGLGSLATEAAREGVRLEQLDTAALVAAQVEQDHQVSRAVEAASGQVAAALEVVVERLESGGRLVYVGAGTSGRLAVLDAAECLPTFGVGSETVLAIMAGGPAALTQAVEGAEDDHDQGARDVREAGVGPDDVVVGISASGRTPYVLGAVAEARGAGAATGGITNNPDSALAAAVDLPIELLTGPELVTGSTRLKAGSAQKMALNMLSTLAMVRLGKVHGTLMVDVRATNLKLQERARRIVASATGAEPAAVEQALAGADGHAKVAIAALLLGVGAEEARTRLAAADGHLDRVVGGAP